MSISFADIGVPDDLVEALSAGGITTPFEVQAATIPDALAGRDVCGRTPTGSGKTIAFGMPLPPASARRPKRYPRRSCSRPPVSWPRRSRDELAPLAGRRAAAPSRRSTAATATRASATAAQPRRRHRSWPARAASPTSSTRATLGLDEVEVVVDRRGRPHGRHGLPARGAPAARRSAPTTARPCCSRPRSTARSRSLVRHYQRDPVAPRRRASRRARRRAARTTCSRASTAPERVGVTAELIAGVGPTIVFCRTRRGADRLARQLEAAGRARGCHPRRPVAGPARAGAVARSRAATSTPSWPPTWPPAGSTSTTWPA